MPISVAHVANYFNPPSWTFVHSRIFNPDCVRPIPLLTRNLIPNSADESQLLLFAINRLGWLNSRLDNHCLRTFHISPYFFYALHKVRPQLIHAHFANAIQPVVWAAKSLHIPLLANFYGYETKKLIHNPGRRQDLLDMCSKVDQITCVSQAMVDDLLSYGFPENKITLIRNGINTEFFAGEPRSWISGTPLRLLNIARLHPEKGQVFLFDALKQLNQSGFTNWTLRIIGSGDLEAELKLYVQQAGLHSQVQFLGTRSPQQVADELRKAHIMVLPSLQETQGIVLQEAQACCTPVLSTQTGGIPEGVLDGQSGFLVPPGSGDALFQALLKFIQDPNLVPKMGAAGRNFIVDNFSRREEYRQLADLYHKMIDEHKRN